MQPSILLYVCLFINVLTQIYKVRILFGATGGSVVGTSAAQLHMRQIFSFLNMHPLERPVLYIANANQKIKNGGVVDEQTRELIKELVKALVQWTLRLRGNKDSS